MRVVHDSVARVLDRARADSAFPGGITVIGTREGGLTSYAVGRIDWPADAPAPDERTLWDLASLTKVVGMTTAMMQLVEQDRVELDAPVVRYLPEFAGDGKDRVTIRHLLTHSSGYPPGGPSTRRRRRPTRRWRSYSPRRSTPYRERARSTATSAPSCSARSSNASAASGSTTICRGMSSAR